MPIMIHSRDAHQLTMDILKEEGAFSNERKSWFPARPATGGGSEPDARVQMHCFSGSPELALEYVKL
ncbi:MAG: TatD family hydrolase, partial [Mogibacterium sp.]|nr:TatD family hydrolase [Mogibacterium sp.]